MAYYNKSGKKPVTVREEERERGYLKHKKRDEINAENLSDFTPSKGIEWLDGYENNLFIAYRKLYRNSQNKYMLRVKGQKTVIQEAGK